MKLYDPRVESLVKFLVSYEYDEESVRANIDNWLTFQDRMDYNCSFKDYIVLNHKERNGETLTESDREYLNELNLYAFHLDP